MCFEMKFPNLEDRLHFLKESIDQVEEQIRIRQVRQAEFEDALDTRSCEMGSSLYALDLEMPEGTTKRRLIYEQELGLIEKERRQLRITYGQDMFMLQKEVRHLRGEYRTLMAGMACFKQKN